MMQHIAIFILFCAISAQAFIYNFPRARNQHEIPYKVKDEGLIVDISYGINNDLNKLRINQNSTRIILEFPTIDSVVWDNGEILWENIYEDGDDKNTSFVFVNGNGDPPIVPTPLTEKKNIDILC
jgi:hypothetical protein